MARRSKKEIQIQQSLPVNECDKAYLQSITRKLLSNLEQIVQRLECADEENIAHIKVIHELLFGQKSSIAGSLVVLSDLLLRLGSDVAQNSADTSKDETWADRLSESDIALVESFVSKFRNDVAVASQS